MGTVIIFQSQYQMESHSDSESNKEITVHFICGTMTAINIPSTAITPKSSFKQIHDLVFGAISIERASLYNRYSNGMNMREGMGSFSEHDIEDVIGGDDVMRMEIINEDVDVIDHENDE